MSFLWRNLLKNQEFIYSTKEKSTVHYCSSVHSVISWDGVWIALHFEEHFVVISCILSFSNITWWCPHFILDRTKPGVKQNKNKKNAQKRKIHKQKMSRPVNIKLSSAASKTAVEMCLLKTKKTHRKCNCSQCPPHFYTAGAQERSLPARA